MVVQLIETLTGREVKLVPPIAYLVSAPPRPAAEKANVEMFVAADVNAERRSDEGPLVVDVSQVLPRESERMILGTTANGGLALFPGVNLEL